MNVFVFLFVLLAPFTVIAAEAAEVMSVGVLANQGKPHCFSRWKPTAAYLEKKLGGRKVALLCLDFEELPEAVAAKRVDFTITNPAMYVTLEHDHGISRIATMVNARTERALTVYGGVIFRRADRQELNSIEQLKNIKLAAVAENSFGGWLVSRKFLQDRGIDPFDDFSKVLFLGRHDAVVEAVKKGIADVGCVRTDVLESMAAKKLIRLEDFTVYTAPSAGESDSFPFMRTTELYPEWPFATLRHVDQQLARQVALELLLMTAEDEAAVASSTRGWTIPLDYTRVHECLKSLRVSPYDYWGRISIISIYRQYRGWVLFSSTCLLLAGIGALSVFLSNRSRLKTLMMLEKEHRERLELVDELTEFRQTLDSVHDSVLIFDSDSLAFLYVNQGTIDRLEYSEQELLTMTPLEIKHGYDRDRFLDFLQELRERSGESVTYQSEHRTKNGRIIPVEVSLMHVNRTDGRAHFIAIVRDISERLREEREKEFLQARLLNEQKMASVGQLAAGIAHEINTPAQYVASNMDFIDKSFGDIEKVLSGVSDFLKARSAVIPEEQGVKELTGLLEDADCDYLREEVPRAISQTKEGVRKISSIVQAMKKFSHPGSKEKASADLNRIIETTLTIASNEYKYIAELETNLDPDLPALELLTDEMGQALLNIIVNATHALADAAEAQPSFKGRITITTGHDDEAVWVRLSDNGPGIPEDIRDKIFDPFFTTKEVGKGTGQGLAIVYDVIVNKHNGTVTCTSEAEGGAVFFIRLPLSGTS